MLSRSSSWFEFYESLTSSKVLKNNKIWLKSIKNDWVKEVSEDDKIYDTARILERVQNIKNPNQDKYNIILTPNFNNNALYQPKLNTINIPSKFSKYGKKVSLKSKNIDCQNKSSLSKGNTLFYYYSRYVIIYVWISLLFRLWYFEFLRER